VPQHRLVAAMQTIKIADSQGTSQLGMMQIVQSSYQSHRRKYRIIMKLPAVSWFASGFCSRSPQQGQTHTRQPQGKQIARHPCHYPQADLQRALHT